MGLLNDYIFKCKKVYEFRVRIAEFEKDSIDRIESVLKAFDVQSVSKPKRLPIQEDVDFPAFGAVEVHVFDITCNYPCIAEQVHTVIHERAGIPANKVIVRTKASDELHEEPEKVVKDNKTAELLKPELESESGQSEVGIKRLESLLKELSTHSSRDDNYGGKKGEKAETTNDLPMGKKSPVGTNKNKIPDPTKGSK